MNITLAAVGVANVLIRRNGQWKTKAFCAEVTCFVSVFFFCLL